MRHFILFFFLGALAPAQIVSVGVKAGIPATPALPHYGSDSTALLDTGRWTVGPTVEVNLVYGFSVEADALYRGYRVQRSTANTQFSGDGFSFPPVFSSFLSNTKVWDFPLLLKYRFGSRSYRPFVDAGFTWSHSTSDITSSIICLGTVEACASSELNRFFLAFGHASSTDNPRGPTAGLGIEFKIGRFKLAPEVRYTHFSNPTLNQISVLAGFTF